MLTKNENDSGGGGVNVNGGTFTMSGGDAVNAGNPVFLNGNNTMIAIESGCSEEGPK